MKKYLFFLATLVIATSCSDTESLKDIVAPDAEIGFSTTTSKQTRATTTEESENTGSTTVNNLEAYNTTFKVWSNKTVNGTSSVVFNAQTVEYKEAANSDPAGWYYSPVRFWDKSATSYEFYAASPATLAWVWDNTNKKLSLTNFTVSGTNRVTTAHGTGTSAFNVGTEIATDAVMSKDIEDLMISNDITDYNTYTSAAVNLHFNHILSRLNIGVRKVAILDDFDVRLKSIMVYNMKSNGTFNENQNDAVSTGTTARWIAPETQTKFTDGVGYKFDNATDYLSVTSTTSAQTATYQYVYQGLVIPQQVAYNPTVEATSTVQNGFKLDGSNKSASSNPYIVIKYEIWTKQGTYTAEEATAYNAEHNLQSGDTGYKAAGDTKDPEKMDGYEYYYNLADVFNGDATTAVDFCEGWQNTLMITLSPVAINFDAVVYEWSDKIEKEVYVTETPANNP